MLDVVTNTVVMVLFGLLMGVLLRLFMVLVTALGQSSLTLMNVLSGVVS
jgi:hypothetical protein